MNRQTTVTLLVVLVAFCVSMTTAQGGVQLTSEQKQKFQEAWDKMTPEQQETVKKFFEAVGRMLDEMHGALRDPSPELKQGIENVLENVKHMTPEQTMQEIQNLEHLLTPEQRKELETISEKYRPDVEKLASQIEGFSLGGSGGAPGAEKKEDNGKKEGDEGKEAEKKEDIDKKGDEGKGAEMITSLGSIAIVAALTVF